MSNTISIEKQGAAMIVRFIRPELRNPLSVSVLRELLQIADAAAADNDLDKLIFTGTDGIFASGADLREISILRADDEVRAFARLGQELMGRISELKVETVAAVNGHCFGGALDLALACDRRIASPSASFCHPGASLGIITGWGGTQRLPRLIGEARALEMFLTAAPISAAAALSIGLITLITDDPLAAAIVP